MKIAIVGASGEVGRMMMTCLSEQNIQVDELISLLRQEVR
jgi:aspartate-semialdehyde dehydrogenase